MVDERSTMPSSTDDVLVAALDELLRRLGPADGDPNVIEARRLRHVISNWKALPPAREVRTAMIVRISELVELQRRIR